MLLTTSMPRRLHLALEHLRRHPPQPMEPLPNLASRVITSRQVGVKDTGDRKRQSAAAQTQRQGRVSPAPRFNHCPLPPSS
jgi:hypothetical protein